MPGDRCAGAVRVCNADADCGGSASCDDCGRCIGVDTCTSDAECGAGKRCANGSCILAGCSDDASCGPGKRCDAGTCVVTDCTLAGCEGDAVCRASDRTCVECTVNAECKDAARPFCEVASGACLGCRGDGDCDGNPAGARCGAASTCVACVEDADCGGSTPRCKADAGICGTCATDTDCPRGSVCREDATCDLGPEEGEACTPAGTCAPGFACAGEICRAVCDVYAPACPTGTACGLLARNGRAVMQNGKPLAACMDLGTGVGPELPCSDNAPCRPGLFCVPDSATGGTCKPFCPPGGQAETCASGDVCVGVPLGEGGEDVGVCTADDTWLTACSTDADCDAGLGCMPFVEDGLLVGRCQFSSGTAAVLEGCDADLDCRSDFCLPLGDTGPEGYCFGACTTDADCGGAGICIEYTFNLPDGGTATMPGCRAGCTLDADCAPFGPATVCGIGVRDQQLVGLCTGRSGPLDGGDACTDDDACGTGLCFDNATDTTPADAGFCLGNCTADDDCGPNTFCRDAALNVGSATDPVFDVGHICWGGACERHGDCPAGWTCDLETDPADTENQLRTSCFPAQGDGEAGSACASADCATGICFPFASAGAVYEDCSNGRNDDTDFLADCADPDCARTAACLTGGEACTGGVDEDGDGLIDCRDPDCRQTAACVEICGNGVDDDGDGLTDCADGQCAFTAACASDVCWGPCVDDADCAEGTQCSLVTFTGSTSFISACLPR